MFCVVRAGAGGEPALAREALIELMDSAVVGIYDDDDKPVATAVFFSSSRAFTAYHDNKPTVGNVMVAKSGDGTKTWNLSVVAMSVESDLVVLERIDGPEVSLFMPIVEGQSCHSIRMLDVWLSSYGIGAARKAGDSEGEVRVGHFSDKTCVAQVGSRHFVYHTNSACGDSGAAIVDFSGKLIGIHLEGWNHTSPPPTPEVNTSAEEEDSAAEVPQGKKTGKGFSSKKAEALAARLKSKSWLIEKGLGDVSSETRQSVLKLAHQLTSGGYAIFVGSPFIRELAETPSTSSGGTSGGSSSGSGSGKSSSRAAAGRK